MAAMAGTMSDEERQKLAEKLDKELEEFIQDKMAKAEQAPEDNRSVDEIWEEMKKHPAFMTDFDPSQPLSEEMAGIQALKYETDDDDVNAESYKEDGNYQFKLSKYRWAIDNYTAGIRCKSRNKELTAILYSNRAAAQYRIGNCRSALTDCMFARKFKPDHMKAIVKGIQCCLEMRKYAEAMKWCDAGLLLDPTDEKLLEYRSKADTLKRQQDRDLRKEQAKERKEQAEENALVETIKSRGVRLAGCGTGDNAKNPLLLSSLESRHPSGAKVHLDSKGVLQWPVLFLYPEVGESDFIEAFSENASFSDHIDHMFGPGKEPAPWDLKKKYTADKIEVYYEEKEKQKLHCVKKNSPLLSVLKSESFTVQVGTPAFVLLVKDSAYAKDFLSKYQ